MAMVQVDKNRNAERRSSKTGWKRFNDALAFADESIKHEYLMQGSLKLKKEFRNKWQSDPDWTFTEVRKISEINNKNAAITSVTWKTMFQLRRLLGPKHAKAHALACESKINKSGIKIYEYSNERNVHTLSSSLKKVAVFGTKSQAPTALPQPQQPMLEDLDAAPPPSLRSAKMIREELKMNDALTVPDLFAIRRVCLEAIQMKRATSIS